MKPTLTIFFYALLSTISFAQEKKDMLSDIENKYILIKELIDSNTLRQHYTDYNCEKLLEKGTVTFYYNSRELKYIKHQYTQEQAIYTDEYYIWDNQLFLALCKYKMEYVEEKDTDVTLTMEEQFYFNNKQPIKCSFVDYKSVDNKIKNQKLNPKLKEKSNCEQACGVIEKYDILLNSQHVDFDNPCTLPEMIYNDIIHNKP